MRTHEPLRVASVQMLVDIGLDRSVAIARGVELRAVQKPHRAGDEPESDGKQTVGVAPWR